MPWLVISGAGACALEAHDVRDVRGVGQALVAREGGVFTLRHSRSAEDSMLLDPLEPLLLAST